MRTLLFFFLIALLETACKVPANYDKPYEYSATKKTPKGMPTKAGACYAKCMMPDTYNVTAEQIFLFTGDPDFTDVEIETKEIVVKEGGTEWVKKKADKNCLSANPDDCLVWCLVEVDRVVESYVVVVDTSATDEYETFIREDKVLLERGGFSEWQEVVCQEKMTNDLIADVQNYLYKHKFYFGDADGLMDKGVQEAMSNFQLENQLAIGQVTLETLDVMGISY